MKNKKFLISLGVVIIFVIAFFAIKSKYSSQNELATTNVGTTTNQFSVVPVTNDILIKPHSPVKGLDTATVTVVEFLDPECEACAATYPFVKKIAQEFEKDLRIVVRYMPYHQNSKYVANILEGIREQNKYWEALELLFSTQELWANHHNPKPELIPELLKPLKLKNLDKILADAKSGKYDSLVEEDFSDGKKAEVNGTPTFFVNGVKLQELNYESLRGEIISRIPKK